MAEHGRTWPLALMGVGAVAWACACSAGSTAPGPAETQASSHDRGGRVGPAALGSLVAADSLANTRIGGPYGTVLAYRFRSQWTGVVRAVRVYVVVNSDGRDGYSDGTGGTLRVALVRDSGTPAHMPTRHVLASAAVASPSRDAWPLVRFGKAAHVVAGHYYHVVFTNADRDPRHNYVSINALVAYGRASPAPRVPDGLAVLIAGTTDGGRTPDAWQPRGARAGDRYAPILDVVGGAPDQHLGRGYMEVWVDNRKPIGGDARVRQLLGQGPATTITGAWLRVRRRDGATAPLTLRIERVAGGVLGSHSVPASAMPSSGFRWVHVRFSRPVPVARGERIALTATAGEPSAYEAFPVRKGVEFGFDPRTVFSGGYAQFNAGTAWVGWDQWGGHDRHTGDLQFALDTARR
ncbi:MAG: hypothetical protein ACXVFT_09820 [Solirubrobacteraceae bacterium]